ncbi:flavanone 3-hydroxylase [Hibiscus syriacus]|uniref:Flavanone 3-hydroxylase n=1 Tax=Hibiscus syriacus TaxID=106335 RepID=A0A6A3ASW8_HIBSY|nr:flavanone 3-hydroxylase [Hibiscus syriacus]
MGCWYSRIDREESVSRCKARKGYIKQLVKARQALAASHSMYLRSLRASGSALVQFSSNETTLHHHHHAPSAPQPPSLPQPPMSPGSDTWTSGTTTASTALRPPPPPPSSSWDFWGPFAQANASRSVTEEKGKLPRLRPRWLSPLRAWTRRLPWNTKELVEMVKEVDEYFLKAADAGSHLSLLLEVSNSNISAQSKGGKVYNYGCNLTATPWTWNCNQRTEGIGKLGEDQNVGNTSGSVVSSSHCSTIERLYAWEKKLYQEVKNAEAIKIEHKKRVAHLRKLEVKRADYMKTEKTKKEVEKLESQMMVASQAIETTSAEIIRLRESELYPQLLELVKGLMCMWRSMYEIHQVHTHIVQQLKILDKVASDGIKSFLTVIHAIVVQKAEEHKQKKKTDSAFKDFEKKAEELRSPESKYSSFSVLESNKDPFAEKRRKVDLLRAKAEEEKNKHEKSVSVTRAMTLNNLQMGFPHMFQAVVGFSSVCMQAFESVYNQAKSIEQEHDVKRILPN